LDFDISIVGNGNLKQLKLPTIDFPADMEKYPAETKNKLKISSNGISGTKSLHHLLIPRFHGEYTIPEFIFTYFDINKKKYITLNEPSRIINVKKNGNSNRTNESSSTNSIIDQQEVELINDNIRYIKDQTNLFENKAPLFGTLKYWISLATIPLLLFLIFFFLNNKDRFTDNEKLAFKKVKKEVFTKFNNAENNINNQNTSEFYKEIYDGWTLYISNKFKIKRANLNNENILNALKNHNCDEKDINKIDTIFKECEMAQYSPTDLKDAKKTLDNSRNLMSKFEQNG